MDVEYSMQNPIIHEKQQLSAFKYKDYIFPSGRIENVQGYEPFHLNNLLKQGINENDIILGATNIPHFKYEFEGKEHIYFPDAFVKSPSKKYLGEIHEVKSIYTYEKEIEKINEKCLAVLKTGYIMKLFIYSPKGDLIKQLNYELKTELVWNLF